MKITVGDRLCRAFDSGAFGTTQIVPQKVYLVNNKKSLI